MLSSKSLCRSCCSAQLSSFLRRVAALASGCNQLLHSLAPNSKPKTSWSSKTPLASWLTASRPASFSKSGRQLMSLCASRSRGRSLSAGSSWLSSLSPSLPAVRSPGSPSSCCQQRGRCPRPKPPKRRRNSASAADDAGNDAGSVGGTASADFERGKVRKGCFGPCPLRRLWDLEDLRGCSCFTEKVIAVPAKPTATPETATSSVDKPGQGTCRSWPLGTSRSSTSSRVASSSCRRAAKICCSRGI
mmetsp:Transcript_10311/g.22828  ORF Transcript_10311/g.22828 Transcript_10311/m.22828 type:complete len:246 (+) Transcript_10311:894-1631(+)